MITRLVVPKWAVLFRKRFREVTHAFEELEVKSPCSFSYECVSDMTDFSETYA